MDNKTLERTNEFVKYQTYIKQAENIDTDEIWEKYHDTIKNLTYEEIGCMIYDIERFLINLLLDTKNTKLDNIEIHTIANRVKDLYKYQSAIEQIGLIKSVYNREE